MDLKIALETGVIQARCPGNLRMIVGSMDACQAGPKEWIHIERDRV